MPHTSDWYRQRAEETRVIKQDFVDPECRKMLGRCVADYTFLADQAEQQETIERKRLNLKIVKR